MERALIFGRIIEERSYKELEEIYQHLLLHSANDMNEPVKN